MQTNTIVKHGSLFSGIGGFDLAAEWMGWENVFHCEWNPFGQKVLKHYWPNAISYHDITKTDFTIHRGAIDILTGGFPCQPYSQAGKRLGKEDERHLWPEMLRAIREIQPMYVVGENVRGLTNWNGGMVFDEVQSDLEAQGYEVLPFLLPACAVNAPHRRDRIWFVANRTDSGCKYGQIYNRGRKETTRSGEVPNEPCNTIKTGDASNPHSDGFNIGNGKYEIDTSERRLDALNDTKQISITNSESQRSGRLRNTQEETGTRKGNDLFRSKHTTPNWHNFPTQSPICGGDDGISRNMDGITFPKYRQESIKAYGNAIVPQVALQIFKSIEEL
tara:strand:- start:186 stop:1181 length:996 start_codon:yes stop_codon:yes gene_type:complete